MQGIALARDTAANRARAALVAAGAGQPVSGEDEVELVGADVLWVGRREGAMIALARWEKPAGFNAAAPRCAADVEAPKVEPFSGCPDWTLIGARSEAGRRVAVAAVDNVQNEGLARRLAANRARAALERSRSVRIKVTQSATESGSTSFSANQGGAGSGGYEVIRCGDTMFAKVSD